MLSKFYSRILRVFLAAPPRLLAVPSHPLPPDSFIIRIQDEMFNARQLTSDNTNESVRARFPKRLLARGLIITDDPAAPTRIIIAVLLSVVALVAR